MLLVSWEGHVTAGPATSCTTNCVRLTTYRLRLLKAGPAASCGHLAASLADAAPEAALPSWFTPATEAATAALRGERRAAMARGPRQAAEA